MYTISIPELKELLSHTAFRQRQPVMIWGQPGVGKSQAVAQVTAAHGGQLVDIRLSQYDSVDLRGIPSAENGITVWNVPSTLPFKGNPTFDENLPCIVLFLDEINSAAPSVSAVAYQLVNDRRVGEHELMDNVVIIAAGNRETDKGVTNKMPTPLANRFRPHVEVGLDVDAVCVHFQEIGLPEIGVAFLQFRKHLVSTFIVEKDGHPTVTLNKAFATPRTWEAALGYYADPHMPESIKRIAMAGTIGTGEAGEFWGFVKTYDQISTIIPQIMKDPVRAPVPDEQSMLYAVTVALSGRMDTQTLGLIHTYLKRLQPEYVMLAWMLATKRDESLMSTPEFIDFSKRYKEVFQNN